MQFRTRSAGRVLACILVLLVAGFWSPAGVVLAATNYYVDCAASSNGSGTQTSPWNTLSSVNSRTFGAGDLILLKRTATCSGMLNPKGSGTSSAPITIGAYGSGARPIISAGSNQAAIKLFNQQGWKIQDVETTGGNPYGIYVGGNSGTLNYFRITNVSVHNVSGSANGKDNGLIFVAVDYGSSGIVNDVIIDNATAYSTAQWNGIRVSCGGASAPAGNSGNIIVRNSTVHDVGGDGIVLYSCSNGTIENTVAYETGQITTDAYGTPNSTWTWTCGNCVVQNNEAYAAHSPGVDGGAYDIDWGQTNVTVQYNYGHDNDAYCVAALGAESLVTVNSIIRYNICANNGRQADGAADGDFFMFTWNGGSIDGLQVYNNTSYWNPVVDEPAVKNIGVAYSGSRARFFKNNIIYSTVSKIIWSDNTLAFNNNLYWYTGTGGPWFGYNGNWYNSFSAYQSGSGQDAQGKYANPLLNSPTYHANGKPTTPFTLQSGSPAINAGANVGSMGSRDFYNNSIPQGGGYDIGAHESAFTGGGTTTNLVTNPGFEANGAATQTPSGWSEWSSGGHTDAAYTEAGSPHGGTYKGVHWKASAYDVYTYQTITGLTNGTYTLKAWVASGGGQSTAQMDVKDYGGSQLTASFPANSSWNQISIPNISVTNGQATIGFYSVSGGNQWLTFDDVEFIKQ